MKVGKIRSVIEQQIDEEFIVLQRLINAIVPLFQQQQTDLTEQLSKELSGVIEEDVEVLYSIHSSIHRIYEPEEERINNLIHTSRRVLLVSIFTYFEAIIKLMIKAYSINSQSDRVTTLISDIENKKGSLPSNLQQVKQIIVSELRLLRNCCIHKGKLSQSQHKIIQSIQGVSINNSILYIEKDNVLYHYLQNAKELLLSIEKHCRTNP